MLYELVIDGELTGVVISKGGAYKGVKFGRKTTKEGYVANGFYPIVDPKTPVPNLKKLDAKVKEFNLDEEQIDVVYNFRDLTEEELAEQTVQQANEKISQFENGITLYIQEEIEKYNNANSVAFENINSLPKYMFSSYYPHKKWIKKMLNWNGKVWETARKIMQEVEKGKRLPPANFEELVRELPKF